jgi:thiol-disulfide isomerase/thioredoxin
VLTGGGTALAAALAGCTGGRSARRSTPRDTNTEGNAVRGEGGGADPEPVRTTRPSGTEADTDGSPTDRAEGSGDESASSERLRLPSLTAPGSPGGPLTVVPEGKVVLLDFFATWCAPCEPEMVNLRAVRNRFDRSRVFVVSLTQETDQRTVVRWWEENRGTWPVVIDPTLTATQRFDVTGLPTVVVLASDGTETFRHVGLAGEERLVTAVQTALDAEPGTPVTN